MDAKSSNDWKTPVLIIGGILGAVIGVVAARLYIRADEAALEKARQRGPQHLKLSPSVILPIVFSLAGLLRKIGGLIDDE
jgi:H+/Cl- antiporter ClcA